MANWEPPKWINAHDSYMNMYEKLKKGNKSDSNSNQHSSQSERYVDHGRLYLLTSSNSFFLSRIAGPINCFARHKMRALHKLLMRAHIIV